MGQIGTAGLYRHQNVPTTFVRWTDHGGTPTERTGKVFTEIGKASGAGVNYEQTGNDAELQGLKTARYYIDLSFSIVVVGTTAANALIVAEEMMFPNDALTLDADGVGGTHPDSDVDGTAYVQSANVRFTPDGDTVIDLTARHYFTIASDGTKTEVTLSAE